MKYNDAPRLLLRQAWAASKRGAAARRLTPQFKRAHREIADGARHRGSRALGDVDAKAAMEHFYDRFARAIATLVNILDPDAIVLGGGLSNIAALYTELPPRVEHYAFTPQGPTAHPEEYAWRFQRRARRGMAVAKDEVARASGMSAFCRDCLADADDRREAVHCDAAAIAFWRMTNSTHCPSRIWIAMRSMPPSRSATIRSLRDKPVIVGGGRGAAWFRPAATSRASTACARRCRCSRRLKLCPNAVVIKPHLTKYAEAGRSRPRDDARPDADGRTAVARRSLSRSCPAPRACTAARRRKRWRSLAKRIENEVGITVSIGLCCNKFLAKLASELDKPRGFAVIGAAEAVEFPARKAGGRSSAARARRCRPACEGRHHAYRATAGRRRADARAALWQYRALASPAGPCAGCAHRSIPAAR